MSMEKNLNKDEKHPLLDVYIMKLPEGMEPGTVYPPARDRFIRETSGYASRVERYAVWRLLEHAVKRSFSLPLEELSFRENGGKWSCDKLFFSLSHTRRAVAAAVSSSPCGVDIESMERFTRRYSEPRLLQKFQNRLCSDDEKLTLASPRDLIELWTKKECIYKCYGTEDYFTRKISTSTYKSMTKSVHIPEEYVISLCGDALSDAQIYIVEAL